MSAFWLKMLAITAMVVDHVGVVFFPQYLSIRIVGRVSMPIMCFFIAEGYRHTHNLKRYMGRLFLAALVSEFPFDYALFGIWPNPMAQNVMFTLLLGLVSIYLFQRYRQGVGGLLVILCGMVAELLGTDYGLAGVLFVVGFYFWGSTPRGIALVLFALNLLFFGGTIELFSLLAILPLALYNGQQGPRMKCFFYPFYPLHLLVIGVFRHLML